MQPMVDRIHPEDHPAEHWPHDIVEDVGAEALRIPEHLTDGVVAQDREHRPFAEERGRARLEDREQVAFVDGLSRRNSAQRGYGSTTTPAP